MSTGKVCFTNIYSVNVTGDKKYPIHVSVILPLFIEHVHIHL